MKLSIVAVGKIKDRSLRAVLDDYFERIRHYCKLDEIEIKDDDAERLAKAIDPRAKLIALEVDGQSWSSARLAKFVGECELRSVGNVAFVIGGSHGLPREVSDRAEVKLSLSAMTLPHRLARVVLAEQIYRAFTILRGEPYSH